MTTERLNIRISVETNSLLLEHCMACAMMHANHYQYPVQSFCYLLSNVRILLNATFSMTFHFEVITNMPFSDCTQQIMHLQRQLSEQ